MVGARTVGRVWPGTALPIDTTLGILGTMVGTAVAALLVPESFREAGSLRASGLALTVKPSVLAIRQPGAASRSSLTRCQPAAWMSRRVSVTRAACPEA